MANGGKGGSTDPTCQLMRLSFGRKLDLILLKAVDDVSIFILSGTDLKELYKGLTPHTHHLKASLSTLSCDLYSLG